MSSDKYLPVFKSVQQMQKISGLGEKKLLAMIHNGEIDYIKNGNRHLLTEQAVRDWYERNKIRATQHG